MSEKIYVWDPLVRLFHWSLVLAFSLAYLSGDEESSLHVYAGYTILGLLAFRIIWGFIGGRYARFWNFNFSLSGLKDYLFGLFNGKPVREYTGHNPAGSWMALALLVSIALTGFSGLMVYGEEGHGPLAQQGSGLLAQAQAQTRSFTADNLRFAENESGEHEAAEQEGAEHEGGEDEEGEEFWEELHEFFANFTVILIFFHISGVILSSRKHGQNLVRAMITGYKDK